MSKDEVLKILAGLAYEIRVIGIFDGQPIDGYNKVIDYGLAEQFVKMIEEKP